MPMQILKSQLPVSEEDFSTGLQQYLHDVDAHAFTVGVPAPFPQFDIYRDISEKYGGEYTVVNDDPLPPDEKPIPTADELAAAAAKTALQGNLRTDKYLTVLQGMDSDKFDQWWAQNMKDPASAMDLLKSLTKLLLLKLT